MKDCEWSGYLVVTFQSNGCSTDRYLTFVSLYQSRIIKLMIYSEYGYWVSVFQTLESLLEIFYCKISQKLVYCVHTRQKTTFYPKIPYKFKLVKNVMFVTNKISNCEFCENWDFKNANFDIKTVNYTKIEVLSQCVCASTIIMTTRVTTYTKFQFVFEIH